MPPGAITPAAYHGPVPELGPTARRLGPGVLRVLVVTIIAGCLTGAVVTQWSKLPDISWHFKPGWLALSLATLLAFEWMHIDIWRSMLRSLGGPMEPWRGRSIWATTLLARYVPTSMLMAVGRITLSEKEGVSKRVTLASVLYEVALTFTTALVISTYAIITLPDLSGRPERWAVLVVPVAALIALHPAVFHRVMDTVLRRLGRETLPLSLSLADVLRYAAAFIVSFLTVGVGVYAMTRALYPIHAEDLPVAVASYSLGYAAGVVAFVLPGALGAREAGVVLVLATVVPTTVAIAVAIVLRLCQIGVELLYAAVMPLIARRVGSRRVTATPAC